MSENASKVLQLNQLQNKLLQSCEDSFFEVHQGPPPFWNSTLDADLEVYLSELPEFTYSICPICSHKLTGPQFPNNFNDPWWMYPQRGFNDQKPCSHLEILSFSILWTHSEPLGAPWQIPCGWGVPALTENLCQNEHLKMTIKTSVLTNGATIFWIGLYSKKSNSPLSSDFWPLPLLKAKAPIRPSMSCRGYWAEFLPLTLNSPIVWNGLTLVTENDSLISFNKNISSTWIQKIKIWNQLAYPQPMKMFKDRFVTESGFASFAIGMRTAKAKGAIFIAQIPIVTNFPSYLQLAPEPKSPASGTLQSINPEQMKSFAEAETLWALVDPFQNESIQDWLRYVNKSSEDSFRHLWEESEDNINWLITANSTFSKSLLQKNIVEMYRDLSPIIIRITPEFLEKSYEYSLGKQSWGAFFISSHSIQNLHKFLRKKLVTHIQNNLVYFRFYESNFLSYALSTLRNKDLSHFYGPVSAWILRNKTEFHHTLYSTTALPNSSQNIFEQNESQLPQNIHQAAQRVFLFDQPRRIKEFIRERTPEFAQLIPDNILNRWINESVRQAHHWGILKEPHLIKFFLWKVLITPAWTSLPAFQKILQQSMAEEIKIHNIETLFPHLRLNEIPRQLTIESWDNQLWLNLKGQNKPSLSSPELFHPLLSERPPSMPLQNPNWMKALGMYYENAYTDLQIQNGISLLELSPNCEFERPHYPHPRLLSLNSQEIIIRDEGQRSLEWLKIHGFESLTTNPGNWIHRNPSSSLSSSSLLLLARQFLEEFPYAEKINIFDELSIDDRIIVSKNLELFLVEWDSHQFWSLKHF